MKAQFQAIQHRVLRAALKGWKTVVGPFLGDNCRFYPPCSDYFVESCCRHGLFKGSRLGVCRLLRCNSLFSGGFDPVPDAPIDAAVGEVPDLAEHAVADNRKSVCN